MFLADLVVVEARVGEVVGEEERKEDHKLCSSVPPRG